MYNGNEEKKKILELIQDSSADEIKFTKHENFNRAIEFAMDEVEELEQEFNSFIQKVDHLEVFREMVKEPMMKDTSRTFQNLRYLIEKTYTKQEKEAMPSEMLQQVKQTQERRFKLLQNVAKRYLRRTKQG